MEIEKDKRDYSYISKNVEFVRSEIENTKHESGRDGEEVILLAAIKSADVGEINYLHRELGINDVGENRVQQLLERWESLDREGLRVHFIGKLQTNKVKYIIDKVCMIHSLDNIRLAHEINKRASDAGIVMDVLVEINIGREENKSGVMPEQVADFCEEIAELDCIRICGFMTMAPDCEKLGGQENYLKYFEETYQLTLDIWQKKLHNIGRPVLSMGMSGSYREAVAKGASIVRVGRTLFQK